MDVEISPEPSDEEREAILAALAEEERGLAGVQAWRRAALAFEQDDQAVAPPRHSRGATRA